MRYSASTVSGCSAEHLCSLYRLASLISEPRRGVKPAFTEQHVVALILLASWEPIGRPSLSRILGLGDTATKTLLRRTREAGLVVNVGRRGVRTVDDVRSYVEALRPCISGRCVALHIGCEPWCRMSSGLKPVLLLRDELVKLGISFEVIACCGERIMVPGAGTREERMVKLECDQCLEAATTCVLLTREAHVLDLSGVVTAAARVMCG